MNWWVLRRRVHISWYIALACLGIVIGISLSRFVPLGMFSSWVWLVTAGVLVLIIIPRPYLFFIPCVLIAGMFIGLWRGSVTWNSWGQTRELIGRTVQLQGIVREDTEKNKDGKLVIRLGHLSMGDTEIAGLAWVTTDARADIVRSDHIVIEGKALSGFGGFVVSLYDATLQKIERPEPGDIARVVRDWFGEKVRSNIPEPQASLGMGYILGQKRGLPESLALALQIAGLTHVVVASGYNLTILVRLARRLFEKVSRFVSLFSASLLIAGFVAVTGASPSMSRAGLVAGLSLLAWYYGRKFHPFVLLSFAAAVTALMEPSYVWGDLGWQLSFSAFVGVMILAPLLHRYFFGADKPGFIRQVFGETLSAFIMTAPILIYSFGQISNVAILANIAVLPLVPLAMLLTFTTGSMAIVWPWLASIVAYPTTWLLGYMTAVAEYLSSLPWAMRELTVDGWFVVIAYMCIIGMILYMWRATRYNFRDSNIVE